jgi:pilus assembly protein CpaE
MILAYISQEEPHLFDSYREDFIDVENMESLDQFLQFYTGYRFRDLVVVYRANDIAALETLEKFNLDSNIYLIVIGKNDNEMSLRAGKLGVDDYLIDNELDVEAVKEVINESQRIIKKRRGASNISIYAGIKGGMGTTTIALNTANQLAKRNPDKNILFLDMSSTKAITNLFLGYPKPDKTIVDIALLDNYDIRDLFDHGLLKYARNFYFISGIQNHTEREELDKRENILRLLNFINNARQYFDEVIIDIGVFEDIDLEVDIQEIADNIFAVTELNIPSLSILKTYLEIIEKSGWSRKAKILVNRFDSFDAISEQEAKMILSKGFKRPFEIDYFTPNDTRHIRETWNQAKLVSDIYKNSPFVGAINDFISDHYMKVNNELLDMAPTLEEEKGFDALLTKLKKVINGS